MKIALGQGVPQISQQQLDEIWVEMWHRHKAMVRLLGPKHCVDSDPSFMDGCDCMDVIVKQKIGQKYTMVVLCECGGKGWIWKMAGFICMKCGLFLDWYTYKYKARYIVEEDDGQSKGG